jgi:hypothetical protein
MDLIATGVFKKKLLYIFVNNIIIYHINKHYMENHQI